MTTQPVHNETVSGNATTTTPSATARKLGYVLSGLFVVFMLFDGIIHILNLQTVEDASAELGLPDSLALTAGVVQLICLALYVIPRTSILGAILLTGYLGGAVLTNLRAEQPLLSTTLFAVYTGIVMWAGLYLRDEKVREIIPLRRA
ncbi:DoxX family protein [Rhodococcus qingshengii]|uniref:DoxX family protein n=1 Tax=Rhodococcus qingshengii TaxID=334542 RepID=UPI001ADEC09A|nr:DoxX family protein [Rhodococcus qingshengii]MBT2274619.1 DoxX family protein [Rhodococcus qingshengii]MCQ4150223.1 DoxX family protein [Rhodococcus qingshengii]